MHVHSEVFSYAIEKVNSSFELHFRKQSDFNLEKSTNWFQYLYVYIHGLRTINEGLNQRYQKIWAIVAKKICFR